MDKQSIISNLIAGIMVSIIILGLVAGCYLIEDGYNTMPSVVTDETCKPGLEYNLSACDEICHPYIYTFKHAKIKAYCDCCKYKLFELHLTERKDICCNTSFNTSNASKYDIIQHNELCKAVIC